MPIDVIAAAGTPELMFAADVRDYCGDVTRHTLITWRTDHGFPPALAERGPCAVWDACEVRAWWLDWQTRKRPHATSSLTALRSRREGDSISEIAAKLEVGQSTVRRWLRVAVGYGVDV